MPEPRMPRGELNIRLGLYSPPLPIEIPILIQEGMSIFLIINTKDDIYPLGINAIGSKEGAQ
jgi:hypothetical protein